MVIPSTFAPTHLVDVSVSTIHAIDSSTLAFVAQSRLSPIALPDGAMAFPRAEFVFSMP